MFAAEQMALGFLIPYFMILRIPLLHRPSEVTNNGGPEPLQHQVLTKEFYPYCNQIGNI